MRRVFQPAAYTLRMVEVGQAPEYIQWRNSGFEEHLQERLKKFWCTPGQCFPVSGTKKLLLHTNQVSAPIRRGAKHVVACLKPGNGCFEVVPAEVGAVVANHQHRFVAFFKDFSERATDAFAKVRSGLIGFV